MLLAVGEEHLLFLCFFPFTGEFEYFLSPTISKTWNAAKRDCETLGGILPSVTSEVIVQELAKELAKHPFHEYYIGGTNTKGDWGGTGDGSDWRWIDGSDPHSINCLTDCLTDSGRRPWAQDEPDDGNAGAVGTKVDGTWEWSVSYTHLPLPTNREV